MYIVFKKINEFCSKYYNKSLDFISINYTIIHSYFFNPSFKKYVKYVKGYISEYNYIFYWDNLIDSYQNRVEKSDMNYNSMGLKDIPNYLILKLRSFPSKNLVYLGLLKFFKIYIEFITDTLKRTFSFGFYYLRGLIFLFFIDACLTDDEPL